MAPRKRAITSVRISVGERSITADRFRRRLTPQFFFFYLLLGLQRRMQPPDDGYVELDLVRRLPHWERNTLDSIGKQVRRHVAQMEHRGIHLIQYPSRVKGPFRLLPSPRDIHFDVGLAAVRRLLDIPLAYGAGRPENAPALFRYVAAISEGNAAFDGGSLDAARAAYEAALATPVTPEQEVIAIHKLGRVLERQGQYSEAQRLYDRALALQQKNPGLDDAAAARTHCLIGWLKFRRHDRARAREQYHRALDMARGTRDDWLFGHAHNGLGLLELQTDAFEDALANFATALDHWCRGDYAFGIEAAYANIGIAYGAWGHYARSHGFPDQARNKYLLAVEWLERCITFGTQARVAGETSQMQLALAKVHAELGNTQEAWRFARATHEAAERTGNKMDQAQALDVLADLQAAAGDRRAARRSLEEARHVFEQLTRYDWAAKMEIRLNALDIPAPRDADATAVGGDVDATPP